MRRFIDYDSKIEDEDWRRDFIQRCHRGDLSDAFIVQQFVGNCQFKEEDVERALRMRGRLMKRGSSLVAVSELGRPFLRGKEAMELLKGQALKTQGGAKQMLNLGKKECVKAVCSETGFLQCWMTDDEDCFFMFVDSIDHTKEWFRFEKTAGIKVKRWEKSSVGWHWSFEMKSTREEMEI